MKIILSPAKKMNIDTETFPDSSRPIYLEETRKILSWLQGKSREELKALWACNDKIVSQNISRITSMDLEHQLTPALLSYEGIAYQYMAPAVFEDGHMDYVQEHLRILSGFYGVLRPLDGVRPYRLEMQAKAAIDGNNDLYKFWGTKIYEAVRDESGIIINLASKEYSKCVEKYLSKKDCYITCIFAEKVKGKLVQKGTYAKMARGEMVRFMAEHKIEDPQQMQKFRRLGYRFRPEFSDEKHYIFERTVPTE